MDAPPPPNTPRAVLCNAVTGDWGVVKSDPTFPPDVSSWSSWRPSQPFQSVLHSQAAAGLSNTWTRVWSHLPPGLIPFASRFDLTCPKYISISQQHIYGCKIVFWGQSEPSTNDRHFPLFPGCPNGYQRVFRDGLLKPVSHAAEWGWGEFILDEKR